MAGLSTGAGAPVVKVYHEKSMILPDVSRVLACLCEKDVEFECVKDSYKDILRLQASRSVPVPFYDGPTFLQESRAICRYIAETYKQHGYPFLLGKDVLERASIEQWLRHEEHAFDPPSRALFCHLAFPLHDEDDDDINREKRKLEEVLAVYEQRLGESEFLAGNKFTLADLVHLPNTHHIVTSEKFAYLYDSRKNVQRWWNTISARDSWQQVLRDMKSVKEQYQMEEHEQQQQQLLLQYQIEEHEQQQQQQQWQTEPPPKNGGRNIRIDPRTHTGTESRTILVPPPSTGFIAASFSSVQQEEQPPPAKTTSHDKSSPIQQKESNFFTTTEKTPSPSRQTTQKPRSSVQSTRSTFFTPATSPTTTKTPPRTETDKSSSKDASSPTKPSQTSYKEAPDKIHLSDFYKVSSHTDEAATLTKPTPPEASKTSNRIHEARQTSEAVAPDKPSPRSAKAPQEIDEPDFYETESKPDSVGPWVDKPVSYTKPDPQTPKTPYTRSPAQRAADTSGPEAGETSSDQRSVVQTPYAQQRSEQEKMASTDQRTAAHLAEKVAAKDAQGETAPQAGHRGARDIAKEAREVHQRRATSAPTRELPSGAQNGHQQSKAPPTDLKVSDLLPSEAEFKEDAQGAMSGDERFSSKRLRKMFEESEAAVLRSQSTDLQAPAKEETPSVYKKPSDVQDRKKQASTVSADGKMGTPSTSTRAPETSTSADERRDQRRATSAPTRELPSGAQNGHQQSKAPPTDLKVSDLSPSEAEFKEDAQGAMSGDERFSTKRLRKMFEESEAAVLRSQSTDLQAPAKEETPSVYKKPSDVQDRKKQASTVSADGKIGTPSTGTRAPETSTSADERRATSPPKGGMAHDDRGATEPRKSPSSNEQEPAPPVPSQSPTTSAGHDDDLAQLSTIDQWQHTSAPPSPIQQVSPGAPSIDELTKTAGVDRRAQTSTPKQTPTDARNALAPVQGAAPSADGISDEQSDKSIMDEKAPEMTPRHAPSSDTRRTSASIEEAIRVPRGPSDDMLGKTSGTDQIATPAASKQAPARGEVPDVRDTGDDTTKRPAVDTKAPTPPRQEPVSSSQQTEQIKGVAPTSHGITGDESAKIAMADESATPPAPASDVRAASTALKGGILDARGKNEAVKPSVADPRGMPTTPRRPAPTPDTQRRTTSSKVASTERKISQSDEMVSQAAVRMHGQQHSAGNKGALNNQASDQAPPLPSFAETRNDKTGIAEAGRNNTIAPDEQPGGRIPKNAGAPAAMPSPMKSQKNMNEAYNDGPSIQQLSSDQSRAQLAGNKKKQGDDATPLTEIGKPKEDDFLANANQNNTGQAQVTSTDGPSKLQMQSDQNKPISNDIGKRTNETVSYRSSATFREMLPSVPEKSMRENQLQGNKSSISLQDNVKQGSEATLSVSGTEQPKKRDLLANADQNSGKTPGEALQKSEERTSSDTQQVKSNTSNSKSDGSSKPTQFDGNEGNLPESQRRGSSTNP